MRLDRTFRASAILAIALSVACSKPDETPAPNMYMGHVLEDPASGVVIDLPANWRGRYVVIESITTPTAGLQREIALRFVRADSTVAADAPMIVALVFEKAAWSQLAADSTAAAKFGQLADDDGSRALVLRRAAGNPFALGTADAIAFDSLLVALYQRPLRRALRPVHAVTSGPAGPAASSP